MPRLRVARNIGNGALLERGEELTHIQQTIAALKRGHGGGLLIIQGVAGIGKSTLLRAVCSRSAGRECRR